MMRRPVLFLFCGMILLSLISCSSKKTVKQASQESRYSQDAFVVAETLRDAFVKKDLATLRQHSTEDGLKDLTANRNVYDTAELSFTPRWVEIEGGKIFVNIAWTSVWTLSGRRHDARGMTVFLMEGQPLKLTKILRANPFIFPEQ